MAFSNTEKVAIIRALKIGARDLDSQLIYLGSRLTVEAEAAVNTLAAEWVAVPNDGIEIYPVGSNEGVRKSRVSVRAEIEDQIIALLEFEDLPGRNQFLIERG